LRQVHLLSRWAYAALFSTLVGCAAEQTFSETDTDIEHQDGTAAALVTPTELVYTGLEVGFTSSLSFKVDNVGDAKLALYEVRVVDSVEGQFYMQIERDLELNPGGSREFQVVVTLAAKDVHSGPLRVLEGMVRVECNDPDQPEILIPLTGTPASLDTHTDDTDTGDADTGDVGKKKGTDTGA